MAVEFLSMTRNQFPFIDIVTRRVSLADTTKRMKIAESGEAIRVAIDLILAKKLFFWIKNS